MDDAVESTTRPGGLLAVDENGRIKWMSKGARALLGFDGDASVERPWSDTFPPTTHLQESPSNLLKSCRTKGTTTYESMRLPGGRKLRSFLEVCDDGIIEHLAPMPRRDLFDDAITALDQAAQLQTLSVALSRASTLADAVDAFVEIALPSLGGGSGAVLQPTRDGTHLAFIEGHRSSIRVPEELRSVPIDGPSALAKAWKAARTLWVSDAAMYETLFEEPPVELDELGISNIAFVPMRIGTEPVGLLVFDFKLDIELNDTRKRFAEVVAQACAHAFERARLAEDERVTLKALEEKEKRLRLALQTGRMLTWEYDVETDLLTTNENAAEVGIELTAPRTVKEFSENIHPDDRGEVKRQFRLALQTGDEFESTFRRRFADGTWRWLKARAVCVYARDGRLKGFLGVSRDVNDEKRAELDLRASEEMLRTVGHTQPVVVWTRTSDGMLDFLNAQFLSYTGYKLPSDGHPHSGALTKYVHPDDLEHLLEHWRKSIETEKGWELEYRIRRHDGVYRWFLGRAVPVRDALGDIRLWVGSATDIEDQKRALKETQDAVQGREVFLAVAAHELRTPLTPLRLHVDTLLKSARAGHELSPDRLQKGLEVASRQIQRLQFLVEALLDVSRIASGQIEIRDDHVDLEHVAHEVAERHRPESNGAEITVECDRPIDAWTDRMRVEQVLTNLVTNAIKYGNRSPVRIVLSANDERVNISVSDQGLGISEPDQSRIFDRFERASAELPHGGLGLGLWIVRQIVQTMGGDIEVESELGKGSTFTVELPRGSAPPH